MYLFKSLRGSVTLTFSCLLANSFSHNCFVSYLHLQGKDYKLLDALPLCASIGTDFVVHCKFIARQNALADVPNKLFFAELYKTKDWVLIACRILHGIKSP